MKFFRLLNLALQFTSSIPGWPIKDYNEKEMGKSGIFFPLIGLLIGIFLYGEVIFLKSLSITATAIIIVVTEILLSGGLHLDGYMDTIDGLLSGAKGEKMLLIMADSNVGAHSVSMLMALILSKIAFLIILLPMKPFLVILLPFLGRLFMLLCIVIFPYPKKTGIGIIYKSSLKNIHVFLVAILGIVFTSFWGISILFAEACAFLSVYLFARKITSKINGLTGDIYGAIEEITEVFFLFFILLIFIITGR